MGKGSSSGSSGIRGGGPINMPGKNLVRIGGKGGGGKTVGSGGNVRADKNTSLGGKQFRIPLNKFPRGR